MEVNYVEGASVPSNRLLIYTGILDFAFPANGFAGGDRPIDALVTSFIPFGGNEDGKLQRWLPEEPPEAVVKCSVAGFRVCTADDDDEFGAALVNSARVIMSREQVLSSDATGVSPSVPLLKVGITARGGNFLRIAYHVTIKGPHPDTPIFDPGNARPQG
ncbi:hypothetical protein OHS70_38495 (plasmid) [Streptomyces sp. NBC_00390]|uniref:hypothetical protein n=1 Tax=Streptomyces sp. NBC_00390 TaxID=2975736 RepID=UPI002E1CE48C